MADSHLEAAVFDLDGVVTRTERVHFAAWKDTFDGFLEEHSPEPFTEEEYLNHVDGRPRIDGVRAFLAAREIVLPDGSPEDPPTARTVFGLGNRKNLLFREHLEEMGTEVDNEAVRLIRELRDEAVHVGVASSSKNTSLILERGDLGDLFEAQVDGVSSEELGLRGKPAPDIFLKCLELMGIEDPGRSIIVEDATSGVSAGYAAGFGLVIGVDRSNQADELLAHGADFVIQDFTDITLDWLDERLRVVTSASSP